VSASRRDDDESAEAEQQPSRREDASRRDLRHTVHEDFGVRVERDLSGSSMFLARGSSTHFHKIKFSAQGRPAADLPREEPPPLDTPRAASHDLERLAAVPTTTPPVEPPTEAPAGLLNRLRRLIGL
jgi:hypothetical protein